MKWEHKCSLEWMQERQKYLCASEIKRLIPFTKTGRVRNVTDMNRLAVWANKQKILTEEDCYSSGAAARGHILEPYAVDMFNQYAEDKELDVHLYHWDDVVINNGEYLGYSPDAINVPQPDLFVSLKANQFNESIIGEIKCYNVEKHIETIATPKEEREERWQIATAMAVDDQIEKAYLILFNPSLRIASFSVDEYTRDDLEKEIETVYQVENDWIEFMASSSFVNSLNLVSTKITEQEIIDKIEREKRMNIS